MAVIIRTCDTCVYKTKKEDDFPCSDCVDYYWWFSLIPFQLREVVINGRSSEDLPEL